VFKKKLERIPTRKLWDHVIDLRERFVPKMRGLEVLKESAEKRVYLTIEIIINISQNELLTDCNT